MNLLPCLAKLSKIPIQFLLNASQFAPRKPVILPQLYRTRRTIEIENGLVPLPHDMNVRRTVIVRIDNDPEPAESQHGRHENILTEFPIAWVI
jgi:hypothetical protein